MSESMKRPNILDRAVDLWNRFVNWLRQPPNGKVASVFVLALMAVYIVFGWQWSLFFIGVTAVLLLWPQIRQRITKWLLLR